MMAAEPARAAQEVETTPAVEFELATNNEGVRVNLKINNAPLATAVVGGLGLALGIFYNRHPELVERTIKSVFEGICQVWNITRGSIVVELYCDTEQSFLAFMEAFETKKIKQRLEEEFQKVGFKEELELTITNDKDVYEKLDKIR